MENKVYVDSGQILIIKKELMKDFIIDKFEMIKEEIYRNKIKENTELTACYSDCCALTLFTTDKRTRVTDNVFCIRTVHGDGEFFVKVDFKTIKFAENEKDLKNNDYYDYDEEDEDEEYIINGKINIEEEGYYMIGDPCSIHDLNTEVYLKEGEYNIYFVESNDEEEYY